MRSKLLFCLCLTVSAAQAQSIRIGDITITEAMAKEYFLDCHAHPDTIIRELSYQPGDWFYWKKQQAIGYYQQTVLPRSVVLEHIKNGKKIRQPGPYMIVPREPSAADFRDWFLRRSTKETSKLKSK